MNKFFKRLALLLAVLMFVSMMPVQLFADNSVIVEGQSNGTGENGTGENSYLTISGIAGFEGRQFASFAEAYTAIKPVLERLCAGDALGQGVATAEAFDALFTNRDENGNATLTYTISGNIVYDETGYANLLTMGRRASHYGNDRHLINFKFVGATGKEADTLTVNSDITLPYEWWSEKTVTSISFENLTITGSAPSGLYPHQPYFEGINFKVDNCNLKGIKIYNCSNVKGTYTITNSTLDGTGAPADAYAIHLQGNETEPLTINISGNTISGYDRGINIDQNTANATISGNKISIKEVGRSCIQLSRLANVAIADNTLELTGGNAITLHELLLGMPTVPEITVKGNTITGNGYLIYDDAVANNKAFTSEKLTLTIGTNTVASTVDTKQGVKGSNKYGISETVATVVKEALTPAYVATVNGVGYATLADAIAAATPDANGVITYEISGKATVDSTGWIQVARAGLTGLTKVEFVGKTSDAEICITGGLAILADQNYDIDVSFEALTLSKPNPEYGGDYGHSTNYFTTWLRNTNAAENTVTYTNCTFPNGACNNQFGKTVVDGCTFSNTTAKLYNFWNYSNVLDGETTGVANTEIKNSTFTGVRGIKIYSEKTHGGEVLVSNTTFDGLTEKAAIVASKATDITLDKVSATDCTEGLFQKDIEGSSKDEKITITANGSAISGTFNITADKTTAAAKEEFNISGGTFTSEVSSDYLADGFELKKNIDGTYGVTAGKYVAQIGDVKYETLAAALAAAQRNSTVTLLADTKENVTISTRGVTLDLNGFTLNGSTGERKPALTITERYVTIKDSSEGQTGTIMREDTAENSGVSSHYVIDIQGNAFVTFESGNVKNDSGAGGTKGASLVRIGTDDQPTWRPQLTIKGGTFTQDNFIVLKVGGYGTLYVNGGTINSKNSYAVENWSFAVIKDQAVVNGKVSSWTYKNSLKKNELEIRGGTVNGDVESVSYDGAEGKLAKVAITGGTVNGTLSTKRYSSATEPSKEMATIEITGGTFTKDPSKYVVEGSAITDNGDGTFGVAKAYLAEVDGNKYYTMDEAFHAAVAAGSTLKLLRNYTTASSQNSGSKSFTIDLNGFTWTYTSTDFDCAAFEINYPNVTLTVKNGTVVSASMAGLIPSAMSGTITYDNSGLVFDGVEITANGHSGIETNGNNTNDTVTLKNSTLNVPNGFGIYFPSSGTLTLDNSTVNAKTMGVQVCSGVLIISGADTAITVTGDAVPKAENDGAIQDGAAISIVNRTGYKGLDTVTISGGKFTAKEGNSAIKAYDWANKTESDFTADKGTVAVSSGTFSSAVPEEYCAEGFIPTKNADGTYGVKAGKYVAQIGDVKYETLADALAAANAGDTVTLLADINTPEKTYEITKSLTIDLNGKTVTGSGYDGVFEVTGENIKVVLDATNGGKVIAVENSGSAGKYAMAVWMCGAGSTLTINGGEFIQNITSTNDKQMDMIYASAGTIIINSGSFTSGTPKWTLNINDSAYKNGTANIIVNGGTFTGYDPRNAENEGKGTSLVADGVGIDKNADGTFTAKSGMAAQIVDADGNSVAAYATLADAIAAANAGETVKLLADVTADVVIDKNITLDLGGKTLTNTGAGKATISVTGGTVTVKNGTVIGGTSYYNIEVTKGSNANLTLEDVTATAGNTGSSMIDNWGTMTIKSGTYTGGLNVVKSEEGSTLTINGGKFTLEYATSGYTGVIFAYGTTTITGGEFIQNLTTTGRWNHPQVVATGMVEGYTAITRITGGKFTNKMSRESIFRGVGKATSDNFEVSGGTFNKSVSESYCADGFIPTKNADGTYGVKKGKYVAQVGSTKYETLADAIRLAAKGKTIKLLDNISVSEQLEIKKAITLDLGGKTLTSTYAGTGYSLLTRAAVTIKNGTYKSTNESARGIGAVADFTLENATLSAAGLVGLGCSEVGCTYTVKNSTVIGNYALANFVNNATINIENSKITGTGVGIYHNGSNSGLKLTATDSTITAAAGATNGIYVSGSTSTMAAAGAQQVTLTRCTVSGGTAVEVKYTDLTLTDCTVTATAETPSYTQGNNGATTTGFAVVSTDNTIGAATPAPKGKITIQGANGSYKGQVGLASLETVKTDYAGFVDTTYAISGGTFSSAVPEEYCADGFIPTKNADGTYGVKAGKYVAQIGDVKYETLEEAVAAVAKNGDTITLLEDCKSGRINLEDKSVTVVLNGKTLTSTAAYGVMFCAKNGNKITIDGTVEGSKLVGTLMITSGTDGHIEVNGGTYESNQYCPIYVNGAVSSENSTVTVKKAIIKATNISSDQDMGCGVYLAGYSTSAFENCTITAPITGIEIRAGKLTLNNCDVTGGNGEVTADANGNGTTVTNAALAISQHTTKKPIDVTIDGGTFNGTAAVYQTDVQGTGSADVKIAVKSGTFNGTISGETDGTIAISGGKFKVKVDDKYFANGHVCSGNPGADGYYTIADHPIISAGISIGEDMSFRIMVGEGYENGSLKYYYIGVNGRVEGEGTIGTDTQGNSIFRIYNVNPQRADLIYVVQYYDAYGNAIGAPKEISILEYFERFYNKAAGDGEDLDARKTFIANFLEYCASAMERSYADFPKETLDGKTWQYRADAVRAMMTRLGLKVADYEFKGNLGRYYNDNAKGNITDRGIVFGSTFRAYYEISKDIIDSGCRVFRQGTDVTDNLVLENGAYRFYFELAPYEFKDSLTITIYNGTTKVCEYSSPLANTLKAISESTNVSASKLAKAAFNYFVALQNYEG